MIIRKCCVSLLVLVASFSAPAIAQATTVDACKALLPASLKGALPNKFPGYRLVRVSDYSKEEMDQHKKDRHGNPCLGIAFTDVDGDGFQDFAFFLTDKSGLTLLASARNVSGNSWQISKLDDFGKDGPGGSYVEALKPGPYQDLFDRNPAPSDYEPEPGRVRRYTAKHFGFIAGGIESSGAAFFFTGKRWVHLWLSD